MPASVYRCTLAVATYLRRISMTNTARERNPEQEQAARSATIARAITFLRTADPAEVAAALGATNLHSEVKADPAELALRLETAHQHGWARMFGAWKAAQQVLHAAGQD